MRKLADALAVDPEELMEPLQESAGRLPPTPLPDLGPRPPLVAEARLAYETPDARSIHHPLVAEERSAHRLLQERPDLAVLVYEAADQLRRFFPDGRLRLDLLPDPDYGEAEQVFLGVATDLPDDEAIAALKRFDQEWWFHQVRRAQGLLCIDLSDA